MLAEQAEAWLRGASDCGAGAGDGAGPPSPFGRRLAGTGRERYGSDPAFRTLAAERERGEMERLGPYKRGRKAAPEKVLVDRKRASRPAWTAAGMRRRGRRCGWRKARVSGVAIPTRLRGSAALTETSVPVFS